MTSNYRAGDKQTHVEWQATRHPRAETVRAELRGWCGPARSLKETGWSAGLAGDRWAQPQGSPLCHRGASATNITRPLHSEHAALPSASVAPIAALESVLPPIACGGDWSRGGPRGSEPPLRVRRAETPFDPSGPSTTWYPPISPSTCPEVRLPLQQAAPGRRPHCGPPGRHLAENSARAGIPHRHGRYGNNSPLIKSAPSDSLVP